MEKDLVSVFEDVKEDIKRGFYENPFGEEIEFLTPDLYTYYYDRVPKAEKSYTGPLYDTKIYVESKDTFIKAIELGPDAVVLNMASPSHPGGGIERGSKAQEEDLCRRSDLLKSLYRHSRHKAKEIGIRSDRDRQYPLGWNHVIYSEGISIYRKPGTYEPYYEPYETNVISAAALRKPELTETGDLTEKDKKTMREKIRCVLRVALKNDHTKLVLGAWGCGAFGCPASTIATLFKEVLESPEWKGKFEEICFAILEDRNSIKNTGGKGNYQIFKEILG